jgi:hypothetical protein
MRTLNDSTVSYDDDWAEWRNKDGELHRIDGPARYNTAKQHDIEVFCVNGKEFGRRFGTIPLNECTFYRDWAVACYEYLTNREPQPSWAAVMSNSPVTVKVKTLGAVVNDLRDYMTKDASVESVKVCLRDGVDIEVRK